MVYARDLINQVREMLERGWNAYQIADRCNIDPSDVQLIISLINNILT